MSNFFKLNIAKIVPYLIGAFLFFSFEVEAQFQKSWDMFYGGSSYDEMRRIIELDDGYLLFGSASYSTSGDIGSTHGSSDYWVQKIDFNGNLIWNKLFGGLDTDILQDAIMDDEGNFVMVGYSESNKSGNKSSSGKGGRDFWVVKIDPDGSKLWDKTFGGLSKDYGTSLIQSQSGNYIIGGWTTSPYGFDIKKTPLGHFDYFVFEVTKNGKIGWQNRFGGTKEDRCLDLCEDKEGNIYLAGLSKSEDNGNKKAKLLGRIDYWIVKIDADGKKIWGKTYGGTSEDKPTDITVLNNGNILISGFSASDKTPTKSDYNKGIVDSWLLCIDPDGDRVWDKSFGGTGADEVGEVEELGNGNLIVYGYSSTDGDGDKTENSFGKSDYWIFILDENRDIIYEASFGGDDIDICTSGLMSKNGDIVITGLSKSSASGNLTTENNGIQDVLVVSLECDLNVKLLKDTSLCIGEELLLEPEHNSKVGISFEWDNGLTTQSRVIEVVDDETILLTTTDVFGCVFNNNVNILASESPVFDLGTDKEICGDSTFYLGVASGLGEYLWSNGETSTTISVQTTGVYDLVVTNSIGCSHEDEIAIIFHDIPVFDLGKNESLCAGETKKLTIPFQDGSYLWYPSGRTARSNIVNTTGVYVAEYTDQYGCSSLDSFQLTVNPIPSVDLGKDTTICEGDRIHLINYSNCEGCDYKWNNGAELKEILVTPKNDTFISLTVTLSNGCSNNDNLSINVNQIPTVNLIEDHYEICENDSVLLGINFESSGDLKFSIIENNIDSFDYFIANDSLLWFFPSENTSYKIEGIEDDSSNGGCEALEDVNFDIVVHSIEYLDLDLQMCEGDSYLFGNEMVSTSGLYKDTSASIYLCDSISSLTIDFFKNDTTIVPETTCDPSMAGTFQNHFTNSNTCDSLVIVERTLLPSDIVTDVFTTCQLADAGTKEFILTNQYGCDSIYRSEVIYEPLDSTFIFNTTCDVSIPEIEIEVLSNMDGCDSIIVTQNRHLEVDSMLITGTTCDINMEGIYDTIYSNQAGCDSVILLELIYIPNDETHFYSTTCDINQVGTQSYKFFNQYGCDSIHYEHFEFLESDTVQIENFTCDELGVGVDEVLLINHQGCDSLVITRTIFQPIEVSVETIDESCQEEHDGEVEIFMNGKSVSINGSPFTNKVKYENLKPGIYSLAIKDENNCIEESQFEIYPAFELDLTLPQVTDLDRGDGYVLETGLDLMDIDSFYWENTTDFSCLDCLNPEVQPLKTTNYTVHILNDGCWQINTILVNVDKAGTFYLPNAFSPNEDGVNDYFTIFAKKEIEIDKFSIFDRWGAIVYQKEHFKIGSIEGWDGKFRNSQSPTGVYVYEIEFTSLDRKRIFKGNFNLFR